MFLKNYYKHLGMFHANVNAGAVFKTPDGSSKEVWLYTNYSKDYLLSTLALTRISTLITSYSGEGILFGDGTEPATISDYCLSGKIITGIVMSSAVTCTSTDEVAETSVLYTITNNNTKAITIGEIGYLVNVYGLAVNGSGTAGCSALIERSVLDVPITLEPGGVGQITYTLRMNYPSA